MIGRMLLGAAGIALLATLGGFVWFVQTASRPSAAIPPADGIVVLTGGSNRIDSGLRLLADGAAPRLLVSGVLPGTDVGRLAADAGVDAGRIAGRVTLGQSAISTHGNAEETVQWVNRYRLRSLVVVTSFYHMPRALAELRRAVPGVVLYPYPVLPDALPENDTRRRLFLLGQEYAKWLFVRSGLPYPTANLRPGEGLK